jgi:hypothetical protein|nr:MAG TPA: hypothetical protein [Caudoviricetes sp.]
MSNNYSMRDVDFDSSPEGKKTPKKLSPKVFEQPCRANGCPCTVFCGQLTQGITVCEFHEGVQGKYFPTVTAGLHRFKDLIDLAERLLRDWRLIDDYNSTYNHPHVIQNLTEYFNGIGIPELAPKINIPCIPIEGKQQFRDESAYDLGNRIKRWVRNQVVKPYMIENSEESQKEKTVDQLSPLSAYVKQLKQRAIQRQQDAEGYF